tara:strand:+ start:1339 stop:5274 length:3936 start_codon:yes stop_codon:yes gene_type:complete
MSGNVRRTNGKLNTTTLSELSRRYKDLADALDKADKKNSPAEIRKLTEKYKKAVKKKPEKKEEFKTTYNNEKQRRQTANATARERRDDIRQTIFALKSKGVGVIVSNSNNLRFYDTTIPERLKAMASAMTISTDSNIDKAKLIKREKQLKSFKKIFTEKVREKRFKKAKGRTIKSAVSGGAVYTYIFPFVDAEMSIPMLIKDNVEIALNNTRWKHPNAMFNIRITNKEGADATDRESGNRGTRYVDMEALSLPRFDNYTLNEVMDLFDDKFDLWEDTYDEGTFELYTDFKTIMISYLVPPEGIMGSGGHLNMTRAYKKWLIFDSPSKSNCFYRCIAFHRLLTEWETDKVPIQKVEDMIMEEGQFKINNLINNRAKQIKKRINATKKTTTDEDIQNWVNIQNKRCDTRCIVKVYDNVFTLIKTYRPVEGLSGKEYTTYELWNANYHFTPLIRWYNLLRTKEIFKMKLEDDKDDPTEEEEGEVIKNVIIDKKFARNILDEDHYKNWVFEKYNVDEASIDGKTRAKYKGLYKYIHQSPKLGLVEHKPIPFNRKIGAYDIEATGNGNDDRDFKCYRLSFSYNELYNDPIDGVSFMRMKTASFGGRECVKKWFVWLYQNRKQFKNYTFYAHNAGKFDLNLLLNEYIVLTKEIWKIDTTSTICLNGAYINLTLCSEDNECEITFRDSLRLLPMGLDKLTKEFDVEHKKLGADLEIDFKEINLDNCFGEKDISKLDKPLSSIDFRIELSQKVYCDYDTLGLLECLNIMNEEVYRNMSLDLTKQLTGASLSKNNFFKNYYDKSNFPIYYLNKTYDAFCREGYLGGRCEAHWIGEWDKKCYYYDFTSLYPDVARKIVPYGTPFFYQRGSVDRWNKMYKAKKPLPLFVGLMKFKVKTKDFNALPIYGIKRENKLLFPHFGDWTEITIWSNEFNYANELDIYDHILIDAVKFRMGGQMDYRKGERLTYWNEEGILAPFFEDAVERKASAKKDKKLALAQCWKIVANSGYGFWGLNANGDEGMGRDGMDIADKDDLNFWNMVRDKEVSNAGNVGEYLFIRTSRPMPQTDYNVAVASAITSEARIKIHKFMNAVRRTGGTLLYCDTDSCICDRRLCDYSTLRKEFCWDGTGEALGSMKNEAEEKLEKYFKKKLEKKGFEGNEKAEIKRLVEKQKDFDNGEFHFDKGIIGGCKQYCLHKKVFDGGFIEASASKGCKKDLTYEDFHHLLFGSKIEEQRKYEEEIKKSKLAEGKEWEAPEGFRLYEKQEQFRSGLIDHIKEGEKLVPVRIVCIDKAMRINYGKGLVEGERFCNGVSTHGEVKPLILS